MHSIAVITMRLIQGYAKEDGRIGLDMPDRCPLGFDFLSALDQMTSIEDLTKVCIQTCWPRNYANLRSTHC